jgi:hypothetical protein
MIVNYTEKGWQIILQRSHGLLAAQICAHWKKDNQPGRWVETLMATGEHDDANEELANPEINPGTGGPTNFKMKAFDVGYCDRLLELAFAKGRYIGMLIARHIHFLYKEDQASKSYCEKLKQNEDKWLAEAGATSEEIAASYELLEFCDAFSLIICQGLMQPENRKMEISSGPDGLSYELTMPEPGKLCVTPWPFEQKSFQVNYESRCIGQLTFKNAAELKKKLNAADVQLHSLTLCGE